VLISSLYLWERVRVRVLHLLLQYQFALDKQAGRAAAGVVYVHTSACEGMTIESQGQVAATTTNQFLPKPLL
jgi:hypothetical protein